MKRRGIIILVGVLGLVALLLTASSVVAGPPRVDPPVDSSINYQGRLTDSAGNPLNGSYNLTFQLWNAETGGSQVGGDISVSGVTVTDGLFNVEIPVTHSDFNGQALWLRVNVGGEWMTPRQEISAVPYALSLRPGARIVGEETYDTTFHVSNGLAGYLWFPLKIAIRGATSDGTGVAGIAASGYGVGGGSTSGIGVYGWTDTGTAIYGSGDVKQNLAGNGLVKAAVYVDCNNDLLLGNIRAFNNVVPVAIFPSPGLSDGRCTLDFGFDISGRFWVATAVGGGDHGVNCGLGSTNTRLDCFRFDASSGTGFDGNIMVLVY